MHHKNQIEKLISLRDSRRGNSRLRGFEASRFRDFVAWILESLIPAGAHSCTKNGNYCQNHTRYMKISPQWGRMHQDVIKIVSDTSLKLSKEATCSNNTHICEVFEAQPRWHGGDKSGKERIPERWNRKSSSKWSRFGCF